MTLLVFLLRFKFSMIQSHIFLTQTFVEKDIIMQLVAQNFFEKNNESKLDQNLDISKLKTGEFIWNEYQNRKQILRVDFKDKEEFTESIMEFYQFYPKPTLLFLGDLDTYSLPLQEGMLRILEEPPHNLFIILFAKTKSDILPTIYSRSHLHFLSQEIVIACLNQTLLSNVKKKLPSVPDFAKDILKNPLEDLILPDLSKAERDEISFWLWQVGFYLQQVYLQTPTLRVARMIEALLQAQKLNKENLQKKFAVGWLKVA